MSMYIVNCLQYLADQNNNTGGVKIYTQIMAFTSQVSVEVAAEMFFTKHAASKFGQAGWQLTGEPTLLLISPELLEQYGHCIDYGMPVPEVIPANTKCPLRVIK